MTTEAVQRQDDTTALDQGSGVRGVQRKGGREVDVHGETDDTLEQHLVRPSIRSIVIIQGPIESRMQAKGSSLPIKGRSHPVEPRLNVTLADVDALYRIPLL